jgi:hypothetical protein
VTFVLVWYDAAADLNAAPQIVNDLDLEVRPRDPRWELLAAVRRPAAPRDAGDGVAGGRRRGAGVPRQQRRECGWACMRSGRVVARLCRGALLLLGVTGL